MKQCTIDFVDSLYRKELLNILHMHALWDNEHVYPLRKQLNETLDKANTALVNYPILVAKVDELIVERDTLKKTLKDLTDKPT